MNTRMALRAAPVVALLIAGLLGCDPAPEQAHTDRLLLAERALSRGEPAVAITILQPAIQQDPRNGGAQALLGNAYLMHGDLFSARKHLDLAIKLGVDNGAVYAALGTVLLKDKDYAALIEQIPATGPHNRRQTALLLTLRGQAYSALGRDQEAQSSFQSVIELLPGDSDALLGLGILAERQGAYRDAHNYLSAALYSNPGNTAALFRLGRVLQHKMLYRRAASAFQDSLVLNPNTKSARLGLAAAEFSQGHIEAALKNIGRARDIDPNDLNALYLFAAAMYHQGNLPAAGKALNRVLEKIPDHARGNLLLAAIYVSRGEYASANTRLLSFIATHPHVLPANHLLVKSLNAVGEGAMAWSRVKRSLSDAPPSETRRDLILAEAALAGGEFEQAVKFLKQAQATSNRRLAAIARDAAISVSAGWPLRALDKLSDALDSAIPVLPTPDEDREDKVGQIVNEIETLRRSGDYQHALAMVGQRLQHLLPGSTLPDNLSGELKLLTGDVEAARVDFDSALAQSPGDTRALMNLAALDMLQRDFAGARSGYQRILSVTPDHLEALLGMTRVALAEKNPEDAETWLVRAGRASPTAIAPRIALSTLHLGKRDFDAARSALAEVYDIYPQHISILQQMANIEAAAGVSEVAGEYLRTIATLRPDSPTPYFQLAVMELRSGDEPAATQALQRALAAKPEHRPSLVLLGSLDVESGRLDEALDHALEIQTSHPRFVGGYDLEGAARMARQEYQQASEAYQRAYDLKPSRALAFRIFLARVKLGHGDSALSELQAWVKQNPLDTPARLSLAGAYHIIGDDDQAGDIYRAVLNVEPDNAVALNNLARSLTRSGELAAALEYAERANRISPNNPAIMDTLGWLLAQTGDNSRSISLLRSSALANPRNLSRRYRLAATLARTEQKSVATRLLRDVLKTGKQFPEKQQAIELLADIDRG